jgi:DNA-binding transcriptional regulator LsrR (DeoR family)
MNNQKPVSVAVVSYFERGMTFEEISKQIGISVSAVAKIIGDHVDFLLAVIRIGVSSKMANPIVMETTMGLADTANAI